MDDLLEDPADHLGDRRLAVARGAVQQERTLRVDRRPQATDQLFRNDQAFQPLGQGLAVDLLAPDPLAVDLTVIVRQGNRRGPDVLGQAERLDGPFAPLAEQGKPELGMPAVAGQAEVLDQRPVLDLLHQRIDDRRVELERVGKLRGGLQAAHVHGFEQQADHVVQPEPGFGDRPRRRRAVAHERPDFLSSHRIDVRAVPLGSAEMVHGAVRCVCLMRWNLGLMC